jgi:hypothetical protein
LKPAKQAARPGPGVFAVARDFSSTDEGVPIAPRTLHDPPAARREIVHDNGPLETQVREESVVVRRPVQETYLQEQAYSAYQPVTSYQTQVVDQGGYVGGWEYMAGRTRKVTIGRERLRQHRDRRPERRAHGRAL